jgi:hypothetical protein
LDSTEEGLARDFLPFKAFKGRVRVGMGVGNAQPTPIPTFPLMGKEFFCRLRAEEYVAEFMNQTT